MLIRIVRLTLQPEAVHSFYRVFALTAPKIRQAEGCRKLELWVDAGCSNVITTYSEWDSESHLNIYRESTLFKDAWATVKPMFAAPALAHSYLPQKVT